MSVPVGVCSEKHVRGCVPCIRVKFISSDFSSWDGQLPERQLCVQNGAVGGDVLAWEELKRRESSAQGRRGSVGERGLCNDGFWGTVHGNWSQSHSGPKAGTCERTVDQC